MVYGGNIRGGRGRLFGQNRRNGRCGIGTRFLGHHNSGPNHCLERHPHLQMDAMVSTSKGLTTAREAGLVGCRMCGLAQEIEPHCSRCGGRLHPDPKEALQNVWAYLIAGMIAYIPANIYPMLLTRTLLKEEKSTIIGGAVDLFDHGSYGIALIIILASVVIPLSKFVAVAVLGLSVTGRLKMDSHTRHRLFEVVEFIGRWSMIDVFVVAILAALVQLNSLAAIEPGFAALAFAASVILTMLAAQSFDPRLIWIEPEEDLGS